MLNKRIQNTGIVLTLFVCFYTVGIPAEQISEVINRPDYSLPDINGKERSVREWDGKAMLVNFWATWCGPCLREIPLFNEIQTRFQDKDFQVLGIAIDAPESVKTFLDKTKMIYPTLVEEEKGQDVARAYSQNFIGLPFTVFVDHKGRVLWSQAAEMHREDVEFVLDKIWEIRGEGLKFEQARAEIGPALLKIKQNRLSEK